MKRSARLTLRVLALAGVTAFLPATPSRAGWDQGAQACAQQCQAVIDGCESNANGRDWGYLGGCTYVYENQTCYPNIVCWYGGLPEMND